MDLDQHFPQTYDNFTLSTYQTCPKKFQLRILKGLVPSNGSLALSFGIAIHKGLECWYQWLLDWPLGFSEDVVRNQILAEQTLLVLKGDTLIIPVDSIPANQLRTELMVLSGLNAFSPPKLTSTFISQKVEKRTPALLEGLLRGYAAKYKYEPFRVIYVEKNFLFLLPDGSPYSGNMDLVADVQGQGVQPIENKTTSWIYNFGDQFEVNQQISGYIAGCQELMENASEYATINAINIPNRKDGVIRDNDFQRFPLIRRSPAQIEEFRFDAIKTIAEMKHDLNLGHFRQNTTACNHYGGCAFRKICGASPGPERETIAEAFYTQSFWNPLKRSPEWVATNEETNDEITP